MPQIMLTGATIIVGSRSLESKMNHDIGGAASRGSRRAGLVQLYSNYFVPIHHHREPIIVRLVQ